MASGRTSWTSKLWTLVKILGVAASLPTNVADYEFNVELEWVEDWAKFEKIKWYHKFDGKTILKQGARWAMAREPCE